ncbi:MAG: hypothetical protein ABIY55_10875 [Kofleriaceae bacterium]
MGEVPVQCPQCDHPAAPEAVSSGICARCGAALDAMPAIDISKLARLDELGGSPRVEDGSLPASFAPAAFAPPPVVGPAAPRAFAPPHEADDQALGVERSTRAIRIDNEWQREKVAKQVAAATPPPPPPRRIGGVLAAVALIAAVIAGGVVILRYQRLPPPERPGIIHGTSAGSAISIKITAPEPIDVMVDGHRVGKTPITLHRPPSAQPLQITSAHATRQIVPDHDQRVDLAPP